MKSMKSTVERTDEEELFKIMGEKSPVGVCIMQDGKFCYFNSNFPIAIGYTADELVGKDSLELIVPEDREMVMENEIKMLKGELLSPYQFRVIHKDGSIRWVMEVVRSVQYHGRRAILGNYMEVTERKQMEEALKENEERYRELANSITNVFFAMDEHLRYTYWNRASEILTGIQAVDAIGKSLSEIFPVTPGVRKAEKVYRKVLRTQQSQTFVNDYDIDGRHYIFDISAYPSRGGIAVFVKDITESKQAEEALQIEKNKLQSVIDAMADALTIQDTEYNIIYQSEPARISSGGDRVGEKCYRVYEGRESICEDCPVEKAFKDGKPHTSERQRALPSGELSFWETTANPIRDARGEIVSCLEIGQDITERKKQEQALADELTRRRLLVDQSIDGIVVLDVDAKVYEANQRFAEMLGYTLEEVRELHTWDWDKNFPPEQILEMGRKVDEKGLHLETKHTRKDGSVIDVDISINGTMCGGQKLIFCVCRDITERKQVEEKLKESEQKYRLLFETSPDCIAQVDREGRYLAANPATARSLGVSLEELIGKTVFEVTSQEVAQLRLGNMRKVLDEWQPQIFEDERAGRYFHHIVIPTKTSEQKEAVQVITRDITERKQAGEALRQSEEKHRALFDSSVIGMFVMDAETMKIVMCNGAAAKMFGFSSVEEAVGINPVDFIIPEEREKDLEIIMKEMFEQDLRRTHEVRVVGKGGGTGWISVTGARIMHEGKLASLVSITDITERKQAVEALRQSEERYRTILEEMEDAYSEVDLGGHLTFANNSVCRDLGYSKEELIGMSYKDFTVKDDIESVFKAFNEVYRTGVPNKGFPWKTVRKDGSYGSAETSISPLRNDKGEIIGFRSVGRDITERKQAEEKLRQSREKYRALFDSSVIGTLVVDAETMKVVLGNQAAVKVFGFNSAKEGAGVNLLDFVPPEDKQKNLELIVKEVFEQDSRRTHELQVVTKDGRTIWISATGAKITNGGRLAGLLSFTDITERKRAEEALGQSEEKYRTILEEMEDAYFEVDLGGHFTFVNNSVCRNLGYSKEELIGMSYKDFTIEDDIESVFRVFNEVYKTGVPNKGFPWKTIRKDGSLGFAETSVSLLRDEKGEIIGFRGVGRDVTERKEAEEKLRQSRENYRALFDSSVIGAVVVDAETMKIVMANQATLKMFGFSSPEAGVNPLDFIPPEEREKNIELLMKEVFEKDSRKSIDLPAVTKDGKEIWVSVTGARITHKGRLAALLSFTDITERKQAEEKLRQSEENYKTLFNSSVVGMYVMDAETMKIVMGNQAAREMIGFSSPEEGIGVNPFDFVVPEDREQVLEIAINEFLQDSRRTHEIRVMDKNGRRGWQSISIARIMHKGRLASLVSFTDITERKLAEESLRQSEENYRVLFDSSVIGTIVLDAETMKILMVNQAAATMFGFSSVEEARGVDPLGFIRPGDKERILEIAVENLFGQDSRQIYELEAVTKDGREIWISATAARIMHEGKLAGLISFTDITEQKKQREQLMMTDRLASLGELASGTAHELNNPLTSIIGFSQLLMEREVPDDIREDLKLINNEAQRAASVTKNLLTFARKHAPEKQHNQINNIIEDVLKLRAYEHKANNIEVERQFAPNLPEIMADYFQIQQVFMNIIINAEYFMTKEHNKGTLTITTKKQKDTVMISFADDGAGIPPESLRRIFDPFFTTKEAGKGTGLGLSICHGIVTEHGGQIYARNQQGKGATIFVELSINGH